MEQHLNTSGHRNFLKKLKTISYDTRKTHNGKQHF